MQLKPETFLVEAKSPDGYAAIEEQGYLAAFNTQIPPELVQEGAARRTIQLLQEARRKPGCLSWIGAS